MFIRSPSTKPLVAVLVLTVTASMALAQEAPPPEPDAAAGAGVTRPKGGQDMMMGQGMMHGMENMLSHHPRMAQTGFDMRMGKNRGLRVNCGVVALDECIRAAQPLIENITSDMAAQSVQGEAATPPEDLN